VLLHIPPTHALGAEGLCGVRIGAGWMRVLWTMTGGSEAEGGLVEEEDEGRGP
jgi:hypothetical protein